MAVSASSVLISQINTIVKGIIFNFINNINNPNDFLYNEFALQFEIGYELRKHGFKVYFEKNVTAYSNCSTLKKEIDILVEKDDVRFAIEVKNPKNGQYPMQMKSFIKDIAFIEELVKYKIVDFGFTLTVVDDSLFYSNKGTKGQNFKLTQPYNYFRGSAPIDNSNSYFPINGQYQVNWIPMMSLNNLWRYYFIEI